MEWESKFSSIVRDTESNLAKVKERLSHSRSVHTNGIYAASFHHSGLHGVSPEMKKMNAPLGNFVEYQQAQPDGPTTLESSPAVIGLLQDKLDSQAGAIEKLTSAMHQLQTERDMYQNQVGALRDELSALNGRLVERGVDLQTERKMDKWRQEIVTEVQMMQSQLELYKGRGHNFQSPSNAGLSKDLHELQNFVKDELQTLTREMSFLKIRLTKLETSLGHVSSENNVLRDSQQDLQKDLHGLMSSQMSASNNITKKMEDWEIERKDMKNIKSNIDTLNSSLERLQTQIQESENARKSDSIHRAKRKSAPLRDTSVSELFPDVDSDIDLSGTEFELGDEFSDLTSLSPQGKGRLKEAGLGTLSTLDLGDITTADDLSDCEPLSVDDL